jgi:hypothetical protein
MTTIAVAVVVAGGLFAWRHFPRDDVSRTSVDDALRAFRRDRGGSSTSAGGGSGFPRPGVYRYATRGGESLDAAVLDADHPYAGVSTIAIAPSPCGVRERWQVFASRWSEGAVCRVGGGTRLESVEERHEFFGRENVVSNRCSGDVVPPLSELRAGTAWRSVCASRDSSVHNASTVVGPEAVEVAGRKLDALHIRSVSRFEGESSGRAERDEWRRRSDGLLLERTVAIDADFDIIGGGHYTERYSLRLLSTRPSS